MVARRVAEPVYNLLRRHKKADARLYAPALLLAAAVSEAVYSAKPVDEGTIARLSTAMYGLYSIHTDLAALQGKTPPIEYVLGAS